MRISHQVIFIFVRNFLFMNLFRSILSFLKSKSFFKNLGLVILSYILLVGGLLFYLEVRTHHGEKIAVPNLLGKHISKIEYLLDDSGLEHIIIDSIYRPEFINGTIVKQFPEPTAQSHIFVKSTRVVEVSVSKRVRYITVPVLINKSRRYAESILKNKGFRFLVSFKKSKDVGAVISQKYKNRLMREEVKLPYGSVIHLVIGKAMNEEPFDVPDLFGLTMFQVDSTLYELPSVTFLVGECLGCETKKDSLTAKVYSQTPEYFEGNVRPPGTDMVIFLDKDFSVEKYKNEDEESEKKKKKRKKLDESDDE
jgi:hypothetical protein